MKKNISKYSHNSDKSDNICSNCKHIGYEHWFGVSIKYKAFNERIEGACYTCKYKRFINFEEVIRECLQEK